jgi:phosphotransferase system HPr (HPr) family protein
MLSGEVVIINHLGLHARAAAQLVRLAGGYRSSIRLRRADNAVVADAKSILSVLTLAASRGVRLGLEVAGEDEAEAFAAVRLIFEEGFGEL